VAVSRAASPPSPQLAAAHHVEFGGVDLVLTVKGVGADYYGSKLGANCGGNWC